MKKFLVPYTYSEYGNIMIEAGSVEEAEKKAYELIADKGIEGVENRDCKDREYDTQDAEEIK